MTPLNATHGKFYVLFHNKKKEEEGEEGVGAQRGAALGEGDAAGEGMGARAEPAGASGSAPPGTSLPPILNPAAALRTAPLPA